MVVCIVDTQPWIEYVKGSSMGAKMDELFNDRRYQFITLECSLAEIKGFCLNNNIRFDQLSKLIKKNSIIMPILEENWLKAAEIKSEQRKNHKSFGLIDAVLVAKQQELNCKLISGDHHFNGLKNVIFLE